MTQAADTIVRKEVVVEAPIERAFSVFTDRFGEFKPPEHNMLGAPHRRDDLRAPRRRAHLRPRRRWQRVPLGPHARLRTPDSCGVQLGHWTHLAARSPANASEVEVRFVATGTNRTRVELEHRHIDRHGPGWEGIYYGVDADGGWPLYLTRYAALINA
jgi:hypothetical protein